MGGFWSRRARSYPEDLVPAELPDAWRFLLARRISWWRELSDRERARLEALTLGFVDRLRWEPARDFTITDEMRAVVAANACRLILGFEEELDAGIDPFAQVSSIILHRTTVVLQGQRGAGPDGVMADGPYALHGQAHLRGPVVLSWSAITNDLFHPRRGRNVVIHEFAHQLDMIDGIVDGMPPLGDEATRARWTEVRDREFKALSAGRANPLLDDYGATNHAEFFAVVTELFFTRPVEMRQELGDLYAVLASFLRQDPAEAQAGTANPSAP